MKYAIVKIGSSQYKVSEGDEIEVEKIDVPIGGTLNFNEVLLLVDNSSLKIGTPFLDEVVVKSKIVDQYKGEKIRVATFKAKSRYRKVKGHRKHITKIKIEKIEIANVRKSSTAKIKKTAKKSS